jgi:hypothetical protein
MRRDYQISKINASDKYLFFHLTDAVNYKNEKASYITLLNKPSLSIYKEGDIISIDDGIMAGHKFSDVFGEDAVSRRSF